MQHASANTRLATILAENPGAIVESVAAEHGVTPREVVQSLPAAMRSFAPREAFMEIMKDIAGWGDVTVIIHTADGIFEFTGAVPPGEVGRGYFNLMSRTGFHGHLRHERCDGIAFVERPFMGRASASLLFFNSEGAIMFKVFVGRDADGELSQDQLARFRSLAHQKTQDR